MKVLVTSGGTEIPIDPVRSITNRSVGTTGANIAYALLQNKHELTFLRAKHSKEPYGYEANSDYTEVQYRTFDEYATALRELLSTERFDAVVLAAAVSDYGVVPAPQKIRGEQDMVIRLFALPKLITEVKELQPSTYLMGFKMLTGATYTELVDECNKSIATNRCNSVVGNNWKNWDSVLVHADGRTQDMNLNTRPYIICEALECGTSCSDSPAA